MRAVAISGAACLIALSTAPIIGFWFIMLQVGLSLLIFLMDDR